MEITFKKIGFLMSFLLVICACSTQKITKDNLSGNKMFSSNEYEFSYPIEVKYSIPRDDGVIVLGTNTGSIHDPPNAYYLFIYENEECKKGMFGVSKVKKLYSGVWGRVDFFDNPKEGEARDPDRKVICRPPGQGQAYAFCSRREENSILLCLSAMSDKEKLAEDIFKTFRWTK